MPRGPSARRLHIQRELLRELKELVWRGRDIHLVVQRARIVLHCHEGRGTEEIARVVGWTARAVRKWRARFEGAPSLETLKHAARSGRPATVPLSIRCQLVRIACERPNHEIMRFRDVWTYSSLSDVLAAKTGYRLSTSEIGRILRFTTGTRWRLIPFTGRGGRTSSRIGGRPQQRRPPMPKQQPEDSHAKAVERLFHARDFRHLRARKYGATVIVESGPADDVYKHMRLTRDGVHVWALSFADRNGRWEPTPFRGQLEELVTLVADTFPWTIQPVHADPERTSDRKH